MNKTGRFLVQNFFTVQILKFTTFPIYYLFRRLMEGEHPHTFSDSSNNQVRKYSHSKIRVSRLTLTR